MLWVFLAGSKPLGPVTAIPCATVVCGLEGDSWQLLKINSKQRTRAVRRRWRVDRSRKPLAMIPTWADRDYARGRLRICLSGGYGRRTVRCAPIKVEENQDQPERARPALAAARCRSLCTGPHRRRLRFTSVDATDWQTWGGSSRSSVKAEASEENGKRGGRPKEKVVA